MLLLGTSDGSSTLHDNAVEELKTRQKYEDITRIANAVFDDQIAAAVASLQIVEEGQEEEEGQEVEEEASEADSINAKTGVQAGVFLTDLTSQPLRRVTACE